MRIATMSTMRRRMMQASLPADRSFDTVLSRMRTRLLVFLIAIGLLARVAVAAVSVGSYDAVLWQGFADQIHQHGLLEIYRTQPSFNHPPIPGLWSAASLLIANATGMRFAFVFKLPMLSADALACWLIWKIVSKQAGNAFASLVAVSYAWN